MKISITELENARRDPAKFKAAHIGPAVSRGMKPSAYRLWQLASRRIHTQGGSLEMAVEALEDSIGRNFKPCKRNEHRLAELIDKLGAYDDDFVALNHHVIETGKRIVISRAPDVVLTGEIPRIDLVPTGGYAAYFFIREPDDWKTELRMPLIQSFCAKLFGCPSSEVMVGVYVFSEDRHEAVSFDVPRLTSATVELTSLLKQLG